MRALEIVRKVAARARPNYLRSFERGDALLRAHGITTPDRLAQFLAQVLHETQGLTLEWESGSYSAERLLAVFGAGKHSAAVTATEARQIERNPRAIFERVYGLGNPRKAKELGNTKPGDGYRFRGGGLMQTTGGYNYRDMGERCGVDFYNHPELIVHPDHALKPALAEWSKGNLNRLADAGNILAISRAINLGNPKHPKMPNGYADRVAWLNKVKPMCDGFTLAVEPAPMPQPKPEPRPEPVPLPRPRPNVPREATTLTTIAAALAAGLKFIKDHSVEIGIGILVVGFIAAVAIHLLWPKKK